MYQRFHWLIVLSVAAVVALSFQGTRGLFESTEGRYSLCAKEMATSGDWLAPTLVGRPHWTKPPMAYWAMAAGIRVGGPTIWMVRLPSAVALVVAALAVMGIGQTIWDKRTGFLAGLVYATSPYPVLVGYTVNTDSLLTMWVLLGVLCYCHWWYADGGRRATAWRFGMWVSFGLGFFTKGPPALLPLGVLIVCHLWPPKSASQSKRLVDGFSLAAFLALSLWWYVWEIHAHVELLAYFFGEEVVARVAGDGFGRNPEWYQPFRLYLPPLALGGGLWSVVVWRCAYLHGLFRPAAWRRLLSTSFPARLLVLWVVLPLAIFIFSHSRMVNYVLPLYAPFALACGHCLAQSWRTGVVRRTRLVWMFAAAMLLVLVIKGAGGYWPEQKRDMKHLYGMCRDYDHPQTVEFILFQRPETYGLEFYLDSPCAGSCGGGGLGGGDECGLIDDLSAELSARIASGHAVGETRVFVARRGQTEELEAFMALTGLTVVERRSDGKEWTVMVTEIGPPVDPAP